MTATKDSPTDRVGITYDDSESIGFKANYIVDNRLGGALAWDVNHDDGPLLSIVFDCLYA